MSLFSASLLTSQVYSARLISPPPDFHCWSTIVVDESLAVGRFAFIYLFYFKKYIVLTNFGMIKLWKIVAVRRNLLTWGWRIFETEENIFSDQNKKRPFTHKYLTTQMISMKETPVKKKFNSDEISVMRKEAFYDLCSFLLTTNIKS